MDEYVSFVYQIVHAYLLDKNKHSDFHKIQACRFHSGKFFSNQTMVAKTFPSNVPENINLAILQLAILDKRKEILYKVKNYIDNQLNLAKMNFFDKSKDNFFGLKSILVLEVLEELGIKEEYESV